jgi:hypothetical protein
MWRFVQSGVILEPLPGGRAFLLQFRKSGQQLFTVLSGIHIGEYFRISPCGLMVKEGLCPTPPGRRVKRAPGGYSQNLLVPGLVQPVFKSRFVVRSAG